MEGELGRYRDRAPALAEHAVVQDAQLGKRRHPCGSCLRATGCRIRLPIKRGSAWSLIFITRSGTAGDENCDGDYGSHAMSASTWVTTSAQWCSATTAMSQPVDLYSI